MTIVGTASHISSSKLAQVHRHASLRPSRRIGQLELSGVGGLKAGHPGNSWNVANSPLGRSAISATRRWLCRLRHRQCLPKKQATGSSACGLTTLTGVLVFRWRRCRKLSAFLLMLWLSLLTMLTLTCILERQSGCHGYGLHLTINHNLHSVWERTLTEKQEVTLAGVGLWRAV